MAENSKIEWTDHTFNPWEGCQKVGPGCDHCYAETRNARFGGGVAVNWGPGAPRRRTSEANWRKSIAWNATPFLECQACGRRGTEQELMRRDERECDCWRYLVPARPRVFCASLADVFDNQVPDEWRADLFELIRATPHLDWLLLTKRIGNVANMLPVPFDFDRCYPNVWLGITVVNQAEADRDIPKLLEIDAAVRFLSIEPMLGPINLGFNEPCDHVRRSCEDVGCWRALSWIICGGESGPGARPMHPDWARGLRDQCAAAGVSFLFKQWGEWLPSEAEDQPVYRGEHRYLGGAAHAFKVGKKSAGRLLDGAEHNGFPGS